MEIFSLLESVAYAQTEKGGGGVSSPFGSFLIPVVLMIAIFYFLMIRPQSKKQRQHQEMLSNLKKGDKVITTGGLYGVVVKVGEKDIILEVAEKVNLRFTLGAIATVREKEEIEKKESK